jgi:hypothetical protein
LKSTTFEQNVQFGFFLLLEAEVLQISDSSDTTTGAGIVSATGKSVQSVKIGDSVVLSFISCLECHSCNTGHPAFCTTFNLLNIMGESSIFTSGTKDCAGSFFGHSSFANLSIVKERSLVNVTGLVESEEDLKMLAPMGCGFQVCNWGAKGFLCESVSSAKAPEICDIEEFLQHTEWSMTNSPVTNRPVPGPSLNWRRQGREIALW